MIKKLNDFNYIKSTIKTTSILMIFIGVFESFTLLFFIFEKGQYFNPSFFLYLIFGIAIRNCNSATYTYILFIYLLSFIYAPGLLLYNLIAFTLSSITSHNFSITIGEIVTTMQLCISIVFSLFITVLLNYDSTRISFGLKPFGASIVTLYMPIQRVAMIVFAIFIFAIVSLLAG